MNRAYLWNEKAPYETDLRPSLECHPVDGSIWAVLVCPGGGYVDKAIDHEGAAFCEFFTQAGYSAFQLDYRVFPCHYEAPLADASRAVRLIRSMGYEKVAIIGFSAGGNLVCCASAHFDRGNPLSPDPVERFSSRPDALISCYAVVSFMENRHEGSVKALLQQEWENPALLRRFSAELNVPPDAPPAFIWHTAADESVPVQNSLLLAAEYARKNLPFEMHVFPDGRHGIGLGQDVPGACQWPQLMLDWLKRL